MPTNARTLLCAVPQPVADVRTSSNRHPLRLFLTVGLMLGVQAVTAGPAAVATLPSALTARPFAVAPVAAAIDVPQAFRPALGNDPGLFRSILESAFTFTKPPKAKPAPEPYPVEAAGDPDELIPFSGRSIPRWLVHSILKAAHVTGVDPVYMMTLADVESSLSPEAKAPTSSAQGLFQFIDRTWLMVLREFGPKHGFAAESAAITVDSDGDPVVADGAMRARILRLRRDPKLAAIMAAEMLKRDSERIAQRVGRSLSSGEIYLAHFLGPHDAERFLTKVENEPSAAAAKLLPRPARANRSIFFAAARRRAKSLSVADVHRKFEDMMQTRIERFRRVNQFAEVAASDATAR